MSYNSGVELKYKVVIAIIVIGVLFGVVVSWLFAFAGPPAQTG